MSTQGGVSRYEGEWRADKEHGYGYRRFGDGREYFGEYAAGRPHGRGVLKVEGTRFEGRFERGQLIGVVVATLPDGRSVRGRMSGGRFVPDT